MRRAFRTDVFTPQEIKLKPRLDFSRFIGTIATKEPLANSSQREVQCDNLIENCTKN